MFNESWRRPVWQIRWAPCWERHRELWRRRRLKPEAQNRADQHLRQPVAKTMRELISISPSSLCLLLFLCLHLTMSCWSIPHKSAVHPSPFRWLCHYAGLWSEPTLMAKCQITPTFPTKTHYPSQQQIVSPRFWKWHSDTCPTQMDGTVADALDQTTWRDF